MMEPLSPAYLAQAEELPRVLQALANATPPASVERCVLVAHLQKMCERVAPDYRPLREMTGEATGDMAP